ICLLMPASRVHLLRGTQTSARNLSWTPCCVQFDWQMFGELDEVGVRRENPHSVSHGNSADQQIGGCSLDSFTAASVVVTSGVFVVLFIQREVRIEPQVFLE